MRKLFLALFARSVSDDGSGKPNRVIVQVKRGQVSRRDIGELVGTVQREVAAVGVFITLEPPPPRP